MVGKVCTLCNVEKPFTEFYKRKQMRDGHCSECKACTLSRNRRWRSNNPEAYKASMEKHFAANKESIRASGRDYYARNREEIRARANTRYAADPTAHKKSVKRSAAKYPERVAERLKKFHEANPEYKATYNANYYKANRAKMIALAMKREAYIKQQVKIAAWLPQAYKAEMFAMYDFCQIFAGYEVDHIVPIQGKKVTGFNVPWNMQILTRSENRRKSNKFNVGAQNHEGVMSLQKCISCSTLENIL